MRDRTADGDALTELVLPIFELNGEFLAAAKMIAEPVGLTQAGWQVLGATLDAARPIAEIARRVGLGLARQSVQRTADLLVEQGWARYRANPRHQRAKLLEPTPQGRATIRNLAAAQHQWANAVGAAVGPEDLLALRQAVLSLVAASRTYRGHPDRAAEWDFWSTSAEYTPAHSHPPATASDEVRPAAGPPP